MTWPIIMSAELYDNLLRCVINNHNYKQYVMYNYYACIYSMFISCYSYYFQLLVFAI